ncbi:uncharacterized protein CANTADRAFT_278427 [Suhomyces tanzawaensis NRRL Y-17324]|uniref:Uncharacterized protein n=1 Tax=Suhomyces tanzawaensis NRRL Y-17324 TaxID=984487 RepID=A0A1E4SH73_9ASCO|nr:uncharacterized protein CANTADRAFT_278427 [Suhomyces tanzawaensis NRRL Y-17324]ODV78837.1 hypothetical protein CANTADRAFT_278427 [Suhomyces tanzawaensis NRRL Y-17324]
MQIGSAIVGMIRGHLVFHGHNYRDTGQKYTRKKYGMRSQMHCVALSINTEENWY